MQSAPDVEGLLSGLPARYRPVRELARGGMSAVYLAEDQEKGPVVLKISTVATHGDEPVQRFLREARAIRRLQHPNIVRIHDSFCVGEDRCVLVLGYIEGETLAKRIFSEGPMGFREFMPIASQIIKAIEYVHARSTVLRDIKPENVMLSDRDGYRDIVTLVDFGLARTLGTSDQVTRDDVIAGTVGFMSPEEISGSSVVDMRSDVYALGAMFYYMLSGKMLFDGQPASVLFRQTQENPPSLRERLRPGHDLPGSLIDLVDECVRRDPNERPDSAAEVMGRLIDGMPATSFRLRRTSEPAAPPVAAPPQRRSTTAFYFGAAAALLVLGGAFIVAAGRVESPPEGTEGPEGPREIASTARAAPHTRQRQAPPAALVDHPEAAAAADEVETLLEIDVEPEQALDGDDGETPNLSTTERKAPEQPPISPRRRVQRHRPAARDSKPEEPVIVSKKPATSSVPPAAPKIDNGLRPSPF